MKIDPEDIVIRTYDIHDNILVKLDLNSNYVYHIDEDYNVIKTYEFSRSSAEYRDLSISKNGRLVYKNNSPYIWLAKPWNFHNFVFARNKGLIGLPRQTPSFSTIR